MPAATLRVDICYRPLRVAWAISSQDWSAFRRAVRLSHAMWGGPYNPIVLVDKPEAASVVELYRADMIVPLGDADAVQSFPVRFPHLAVPFF